MLGNIKVLGSMTKAHIIDAVKRKEYAYGNSKHSLKESREVIYALLKKLTWSMIKGADMELVIEGKENLPKKGPVLYVADHKSIFDIVVLVATIEEPCIFVGKKEVARMPMINKWFDSLGCIYLDRDDKKASLKAIMRGIDELKNGQSVVIFPEGTRTFGDEIKPFKAGSFKLATKAKVPIVPIAIHNTYKVFEEHKGIRQAKVTLRIGTPIETKDLTREQEIELPKQVEDVVRGMLQQIVSDSNPK